MAVAIINGEDCAGRHWRAEARVLVPFPVLGELLFGAALSGRREENTERVRQFMASARLGGCGSATCEQYAELRLRLRRQGTPIPEPDIWIAAVCLANGARLASRDTHFDGIPELDRDEWR
ncbi:MAG: PIN domain-containing protein [Armatimonadetes bacterium]|nr:PIN domain-containing protein [Armatimonadota bacterium]